MKKEIKNQLADLMADNDLTGSRLEFKIWKLFNQVLKDSEKIQLKFDDEMHEEAYIDGYRAGRGFKKDFSILKKLFI